MGIESNVGDLRDEVASLRTQVERLATHLNTLEDVNAIRKVQFAYGYYLDKCLYDEVVDLFADNGQVHFMGGIFRGKAGLRRLYCDRFRRNFTQGCNGPIYGLLLDHLQLQDIVDVAPGRGTARGRFRYLMQAGVHETKTDMPPHIPRQWWEGGVYENTYIREGQVWKILVNNCQTVFRGDYDAGWAHSAPEPPLTFTQTFPDDPGGPDEIETVAPAFWPQTGVTPFHYTHPVTGKPWSPAA